MSIQLAEKTEIPIYKTKEVQEDPALSEFKEKMFDIIIQHIDLTVASRMSKQELRREIEGYLADYTERMKVRASYRELQVIIDDILNDMIGLGPLEILLFDKSINDIMVNSPNRIFIERQGRVYLTDIAFRSEKHVFQIAQRIANQVGRRIDESSPMVDARLKDGSRVNIIIPPIALEGTSISIRKFSAKAIHLNEMVERKSISNSMYDFFKMAAGSRLNIIVSGGTGSGKTTLLNALSELINPNERIISLEDAAELKLQQPHVIRLESRPPNIEGEGQVSISDLLKNALRMRPDRIIIGECRGAEAFDMLQAMNTGHDGSMSTLHANSTLEALGRLENLVLMSGFELPTTAIRTYVADAIDLVIQVSRMRDGVRRVVQITHVSGYEDGAIQTHDIFAFQYGESTHSHIEGEFKFRGLNDELCDRFKESGFVKELESFLNDNKI